MRYLFPILLLAASILLCICAAPSVVSTSTLPQASAAQSPCRALCFRNSNVPFSGLVFSFET